MARSVAAVCVISLTLVACAGDLPSTQGAPTGATAAGTAGSPSAPTDPIARSRVEMVRHYAETSECRRAVLLSYFGEPFEPPCGTCDACEAGTSSTGSSASGAFAPRTRVAHRSWGEGIVLRTSADRVVVQFATVGYRTLDLALVEERGLLRAVG